MDAVANMFYGYSKNFYLSTDEDGQWDEMIKLVEKFGVSFFQVGEEAVYFYVIETFQRFNWNYSPQKLNTQQIFNIEKSQWNEKLKQACQLVGLKWDESNADWLVTCNYC